MDDPQLEEQLHVDALKGLQRINWLSRCWTALWRPIRNLARASGHSISVLDVACGGGDFLRQLSRQAAKEELAIRLVGLDISPKAIEHAKDSSQSMRCPIEFLQGNASQLAQGPRFDVVCCSLFMHHLPAVEAVELLRQMKTAASQFVLVQDLLRTTAGYWLARTIPKLMTRSQIVHVDGVRSVKAAFSLNEVTELANAAGLDEVKIRKLWPQRFLLQSTCASEGVR